MRHSQSVTGKYVSICILLETQPRFNTTLLLHKILGRLKAGELRGVKVSSGEVIERVLSAVFALGIGCMFGSEKASSKGYGAKMDLEEEREKNTSLQDQISSLHHDIEALRDQVKRLGHEPGA